MKYPLFSYFEINNLPNFILTIINPNLFWLFRIIPLASLSLTIFLISRRFKNKIFGAFFLTTTPWIFLLSREFYLPPIIVVFLLVIFIYSNKKFIISLLIVSYLLLVFFINQPTINQIKEKIELLKNSFNLVTLFFQGESLTNYLRVPKIGYFQTIVLPIFLLGLYQIFKKSKIKDFLLLGIFSLIFLFVSPTNHFIFAGSGLLFITTKIIIYGFNQLTNKKIFLPFFLLLYFLNSLFFFEMYFRHYQIKYSHERRMAKINLIEKLVQLNNKKVFMVKDDEINNLLTIYSYHYPFPTIIYIDENDWSKVISRCNDKKVVCVLNEAIVEYLKLNKDSPLFTFILNADGGKAYFLLGATK